MENKFITGFTIGLAALFVIFSYTYGLHESTSGDAIESVDGSSSVQGIIGIILLLMLVVSIFFVIGNLKVMAKKNLHKKP